MLENFEFNTDKFASDIGYGTELAAALDRIAGQQQEFGLRKAITIYSSKYT